MVTNRIQIMCDVCGDYDSVPGSRKWPAEEQFIKDGWVAYGKLWACKKCNAVGRKPHERLG